MILVVGATGLLGGTIVRQALASGEPVRALVRSGSRKVEALASEGAEVTFGDLLNHGSLVQACQGVRVVVSTASAMSSQNPDDSLESVDRDGQCRLVDCAEAAGVQRIVFVSSPEHADVSPLQLGKQAVESRLRAGKTPFTILRPSFLMEVWLSPALGFDYVEGRVRVYGSGSNRISWLSLADAAKVAVWAAREQREERSILEIGGPAAVSPLEAIATFERLSGRRFDCEKVPELALREQYSSTLDPRQRTFFAVALQYARGHRVDPESLGGAPRPSVTVETFARRVLDRP